MISYVKDSRINQDIFIDKVKAYTEVRGVGKIQLFNSKTGVMEVEAVSENVVTYAQSLITYYNNFVSYIGGKGISENNYQLSLQVDPFKNIYFAKLLNEGVDPVIEDPYNIKTPTTHVVTGYAERYSPYSGESTTKGTINNAESKFYRDGTDLVAHFVFDFPTHAGNGEFDCVYWAQDYCSKDFELNTVSYNTGQISEAVSTIIPMEDGRNSNILLAVCTTTEAFSNEKTRYKLSAIYVFDKDMNFLFCRNMEPYITTIPLNGTIVFNMRSDGKIALIDSVKDKIHLYDYETDVIIQSIDVPNLGIDKCTVYEKNYLYSSNTKLQATSNDIYSKSLVVHGEGVKAIWSSEDSGVNAWSLKVQDGKIMGKYKEYSNQIWIDVSESVKTIATKITAGSNYYKNYQNVRSNKMNIKAVCKNDSKGQLVLEVTRSIIGFMGAFTKLPSKLTKTESNTMKIQYDFRFEDIMNKFLSLTL